MPPKPSSNTQISREMRIRRALRKMGLGLRGLGHSRLPRQLGPFYVVNVETQEIIAYGLTLDYLEKVLETGVVPADQ